MESIPEEQLIPVDDGDIADFEMHKSKFGTRPVMQYIIMPIRLMISFLQAM
jgi:hypothetical protein